MSKRLKTKKSKKNEKTGFSLFYLTFVGELVQLTTELIVKDHKQTEDEVEISEKPVGFVGYLLDEDSSYYYIGDNPQEITTAVRKTKVVSVEPVKIQTPLEALLDQIPDPEDDQVN